MSESAESRFVKFAKEHRRSTLSGGSEETNLAYKNMIKALHEIRSTPDKGVNFLREVASEDDKGVAAWAALYLLPYDETKAIEVLEQVASLGVPRLSFGARITLSEWKAGRLKVD